MIKLSEKAVQALQGLSIISNSMIINKDNLYVKLIDDEQKGMKNIVAEYKLEDGDIELDNDFGIFNIQEFLKIINSCDKETLELSQVGNTINIKDNRKKITYYTQSVDALPVKNPAGDALYESGEIGISFALVETEIDKIKKDLSLLKADKIELQSKDDNLYLIANSSISGNKTEILINKDYVQSAEIDFVFPTTEIFDAILSGNYKVTVKKCKHGNAELLIMKLEAMDMKGLQYTLVSVD